MNFQGNCVGTCPKCESELAYLSEELKKKEDAGESIQIKIEDAPMRYKVKPLPGRKRECSKRLDIYSTGFIGPSDLFIED